MTGKNRVVLPVFQLCWVVWRRGKKYHSSGVLGQYQSVFQLKKSMRLKFIQSYYELK